MDSHLVATMQHVKKQLGIKLKWPKKEEEEEEEEEEVKKQGDRKVIALSCSNPILAVVWGKLFDLLEMKQWMDNKK